MTDQKKINEALKLLDSSYNIKKNVIKVNTHNTISHEVAKLIVAYQWMKDGYDIYTEVIFKGKKGRGDIYIPEKLLVIEILHSEQMKDALTKENYYPSELQIDYITTDEVLK